MEYVEDLALEVYCLFDDLIAGVLRDEGIDRIRQRGPDPSLTDAEALTIMVLGEWLGLHHDTGIYRHASLHWRSLFPDLPCRTSFTRQLAGLFGLYERLWQVLLHSMSVLHDELYIADSFPMVSCIFARAPRRKRLLDIGRITKCATKKMWYFGVKGHLLIHRSGVIVGAAITPANEPDRPTLDLLMGCGNAEVLGDMAYLCRGWQEYVETERGIRVLTKVRKNMKEDPNGPREKQLLRSVRMKVETVIGQLTGRFGMRRIWAMDSNHLLARFMRKVLAHTLGVYLNIQAGRPSLQLKGLFPV